VRTSHILPHTFGTTLACARHGLVLVAELTAHRRVETSRGYTGLGRPIVSAPSTTRPIADRRQTPYCRFPAYSGRPLLTLQLQHIPGLRRRPATTAFMSKTAGPLRRLDRRLSGRIGFRDAVRDSARSAVKSLPALGIPELVLMSDHPAAAQAIARQLRLDQCHAGMMSEGKVKLVESLREQGRHVAGSATGSTMRPPARHSRRRGGRSGPRNGRDALLEEDLGSAVAAIRLARTANETVRRQCGGEQGRSAGSHLSPGPRRAATGANRLLETSRGAWPFAGQVTR
jgi:hypothetical protein